MKQLDLFLLALLIFISSSWDNAAGQRLKEAGPKVALNISTLSGSRVTNLDSRSSFSIGGFIALRINENLIIQPELVYSSKGASTEVIITKVARGELTFRLRYFEMPILMKLLFLPRTKSAPSVVFGPYLATKLSGQTQLEAPAEFADLISSGTADFATDHSFDLGLIIGGSVNVVLPKGKLIFEVRYLTGLTKIEGNLTNRVFSFGLGYSFLSASY